MILPPPKLKKFQGTFAKKNHRQLPTIKRNIIRTYFSKRLKQFVPTFFISLLIGVGNKLILPTYIHISPSVSFVIICTVPIRRLCQIIWRNVTCWFKTFIGIYMLVCSLYFRVIYLNNQKFPKNQHLSPNRMTINQLEMKLFGQSVRNRSSICFSVPLNLSTGPL